MGGAISLKKLGFMQICFAFQYIIILALAAVAFADNGYKQPQPKYNSYKQPQYQEGPANYKYAYGVRDYDAYGGAVDFGQEEERDGYSTKGSYRVLLPDGRTQTVYYTVADEYSGYVADVQYEGKATYGEPHKQSYKPKQTYKPQPSYKSAPSYSS